MAARLKEAVMRNEARDNAEKATARRARLLTVSHYFEAHRGGVEIVAGRLAQELGGAFHVLWLATGEARPSSGVRRQPLSATNVIERAAALPYPLLSFRALPAIFIAARESDAILVHDAIYMTSVAAFAASRVHRKPFVVVQHIGLVPYRHALLAALMRAANRPARRSHSRQGRSGRLHQRDHATTFRLGRFQTSAARHLQWR